MKPKITNDYKHGNAQIFKNPFLERLTKTDPISNIVVYGITIGLLIYYAISFMGLSILEVTGLFIFGLFFWTFAEYMLSLIHIPSPRDS